METWWEGISTLNRVFICSAIVFSLLFVWQIIMTAVGVGSHDAGHFGGSDIHGDLNAPIHYEVNEFAPDAFTLLSVRSILAFATIFSWSGAIYLADNTPVFYAIVYSFIWGFLAMLGVSLVLHFLLGMQEQGNVSAAWAIGEEGAVYINIPQDGLGKARLMIRGVVTFMNARSKSGSPIAAGTRIKVVNILNQNTVEVIELWESEGN